MNPVLNRDELAAIVGPSAALMMFGQAGACVGRTFRLLTGAGRELVVTMTAEGARIDRPLSRGELRRIAREMEIEREEIEGEV